MTETFSGRIDGMDAEQYSMQHFENLAEQAKAAEELRVEAGVLVKGLDMDFSVATWLTDREEILAAIGTVLDRILAIDGRSTGTFEFTVELPDRTQP